MSRRRTAVVKQDNTAESVCPHCGVKNTIEVVTRIRPSTPVRTQVRCECGHSHAVFLERRTFVRKKVNLPGHFQIRGEKSDRAMRIRNLSRTGFMFEPEDGSTFNEGDRIQVDFSFGNKQRTFINKSAKVVRIADAGIGAEFVNGRRNEPLDPVYDLALAMYDPTSDPQAVVADEVATETPLTTDHQV